MNSGPTSERVYDAIRREILSRAFRPGQRLDPALLAQGLASSVTPVRDALHLLVGRGLVQTGTSEGFHIAHIDEPALKDLYAWNLEVLQLSIRAWPLNGSVRHSLDLQSSAPPADAMATICATTAGLSRNAEHAGAVGALNDRLHAIRTVEASVSDRFGQDVGPLADDLGRFDGPSLRRRLTEYHRLRQRKAAEIVRAHYRS